MNVITDSAEPRNQSPAPPTMSADPTGFVNTAYTTSTSAAIPATFFGFTPSSVSDLAVLSEPVAGGGMCAAGHHPRGEYPADDHPGGGTVRITA